MMSPGVADLRAWWMQLERMMVTNEIRPIDPSITDLLLADAVKEKERTEIDQIIARLMFKPCFSYIEQEEKNGTTLRKKFRHLALYYFCTRQYEKFGHVVLSSIVREWPVTISYAEENRGDPYTWDRAPISIAMKGSGYIRKEGYSYVIRVLALEDCDIGTILSKAEASTQLLEIDEHGQERSTTAFIVELNREGPNGAKREASASVTSAPKRGRQTRGAKSAKEETLDTPPPPAFFEAGFYHLPGHDGTCVFGSKQGRSKADFAAKDSKSIVFTIHNISIIDPDTRSTINQKYCMKTHFDFRFADYPMNIVFDVKTTDFCIGIPSDPNVFFYQTAVKSMSFEAESNPSTHWKKSMSAIWDNLYHFYDRMGMLSDVEKQANGESLGWCRVRDMVTHFISARSDIEVRPLLETELRTVSRMILARRLYDVNAKLAKGQPGNPWIINTLSDNKKAQIQEQYLHKPIVIREAETFTQALNREMQGVKLSERFLINKRDFTENLISLTSGEGEEASCSIYSWLHSAAEIIAGQTLHSSSPKSFIIAGQTLQSSSNKTSVRMFNRHMITLVSAESARRTVDKIINLDQSGMRTAGQSTKVLLIRLDEREEWRLLFEMIEPMAPQPHHFGFHHAKAIKETKLALDKQQPKHLLEAARSDGVVAKTKLELCGLFAVLKTGYLGGFRRMVELNPHKLAIRQIFKGDNASSDSVYPYDFKPSTMRDNEINPIIGPMQNVVQGDENDEIYSSAETMAQTLATMTIDECRAFHHSRDFSVLADDGFSEPTKSKILKDRPTAPTAQHMQHLQQQRQQHPRDYAAYLAVICIIMEYLITFIFIY
ncbi:hypothetical protein PFISCL1PPCAC_7307 [Pristionchus fissidentatus]|uniref:Uncharacterized protein n=1 Tax=Pristionchus fissidentatus TaxID=1538716 RepID=A0AAV5V8P3_9BILA|nr:hypothetical protein PFISCL1PPCAC_7307 [Pristionchus fissidentatus]